MTKIKSARLIAVLLGCGVLVACNSGHNTTTPTTSAYQTQPVSAYKNTLQNLSGERLAKLVVVDAKFQPLKTIDNFNCQKDYLCGISEKDLQNARGLEFYNQSGQLISATLVRAHSNNFYADDLHLGAYLMAKAKFENRSDITALDNDSFDQLQILGKNYRLYPKTNDDSINMDSMKKILLDTKGMKLSPTTKLQSNSKSLQGTFGGGNSACLEAAKQMGAAGELGGAITKFTDALGNKNPWFEAVGGVFKVASAFTNGGCDISSQTMSMLNEIDRKLDIVIEKQNQTIDAIGKLDNKIDINEVNNRLNTMDETFNKLAALNTEYMRFLGFKNGEPIRYQGRELQNLNDYVAYAGGFDNAMNNAQFRGILTTVVPQLKTQLATATAINPSSSLGLLWSNSATLCNPNASGNLVANLALCSYGAGQVIKSYLPQVVMSEQILTSIESFVITTSADESSAKKLENLMTTQPDSDYVKKTYTMPYINAITEHYKTTDNWYVTVNGKAPNWLEFVDNINNEGESNNLICSVDDVTKTAGENGTTAKISCVNNGNKKYETNEKVIDSQTLTNIQWSYNHYDYKLFNTYTGIGPSSQAAFLTDLPVIPSNCDLSDTSMIGPREPLYHNKRMILKTKCSGHQYKGYVYVDLKAIPGVNNSKASIGTTPAAYKLNDYWGYLAHFDYNTMDNGSDFIPKGNYLEWCATDHIRTYQKDGKTYAHQIMTCWDEANWKVRTYSYDAYQKYLSRLNQFEVRYVLDNNNPVNQIICNINSDYHNQLTCSDKYLTFNGSVLEQVDSHQLLSYGKIAYTYDDGRKVDQTRSYRHLGAATWFDRGDDYLEQTFNNVGNFHNVVPFDDRILYENKNYRNYERLYVSTKQTDGYAKFFDAVEKVQDVKLENEIIK